MSYLPLYVKVEGQAHSNHRSPGGVYKIDVRPEKTLVHSACAALSIARLSVPFLDENTDHFTLSVFTVDGLEVVIKRELDTKFEDKGLLSGRVQNYPEIIDAF